MKILITAPFSDSCLKQLQNEGFVVDYRSWLESGKLHMGESLLAILKDGNYDIVIVEGDEIKEPILEKISFKLIGAVRGDPNNIAVEAATAKRIPVLAVPGRNTIAVAELTMALILNQARHIKKAELLLKDDFFVDDFKDFADMYTKLQGFELNGRVVGIVGLGSIGFEVAKRLISFGVSILVYDPYVLQERVEAVDAKVVDLDTLLRESDIVTIHCTPTEETRRLIGAREFSLMKKTAIFINTARASITDENALLEALNEGTIAGAGLDVFSMEPVDSDNIFLELENVTVMPHMGSNTLETIERQSRIITDAIIEFAQRKRPRNIVNPEVFD
ncbi:MAG: NAD(P)-binding domain-containing protein [Candidatus Thorarchaeota archaeon]|nr:NAD(P)-binding domain-containing protein [Candidatus Thorarchaeota archaeon]